MMSITVYVGSGRGARFNLQKFAARFAQFLAANPTITNDAALDAYIDARTDAEVIGVCRTMLKAILEVVPPQTPQP